MTSAVYDFKAIKSQVKDGDWWKPAKDEAMVLVDVNQFIIEDGAKVDGIPDRISIETEDPGYLPWALLGKDRHRVVITLDGLYQAECVAADRKAGWVKRYTDVTRMLAPGAGMYETVYGKVEFSIKP